MPGPFVHQCAPGRAIILWRTAFWPESEGLHARATAGQRARTVQGSRAAASRRRRRRTLWAHCVLEQAAPAAARCGPCLQEYARARILQFAQAFASRLNPTVSPTVVQQAALDCLQALPPADYSGVALEQRDLQLVFRHDCL